jgi:hypothetical protein
MRTAQSKHSLISRRGRRVVIDIPFEIPSWPARKPTSSIPAYSPLGDSDDRPNILDARYAQSSNDAPVELPLSSSKTVYMIVAGLALAFIATIAGFVFTGLGSAR